MNKKYLFSLLVVLALSACNGDIDHPRTDRSPNTALKFLTSCSIDYTSSNSNYVSWATSGCDSVSVDGKTVESVGSSTELAGQTDANGKTFHTISGVGSDGAVTQTIY